MLDLDIDISGLKQMESALTELAKEISITKAAGMLTSALRDGAKEYQADMQQNATESSITRMVKTLKGQKVEIRPGFLKSRIKVSASTNRKGAITRKFGKNVVSLVKVGVFKVPYIVPYEYGTSKQSGNPIIRNAHRNKSATVVNVIQARLARKILLSQNRIAKKKAS